ncbi:MULTISPECIES: APC family permease [unclassified Acidisoma]|jgi:amino acid transporter|uniref:APC family permease n=1 Tax=unclassified Acidisoma TaxID=2634065 RepID=UPI00131DFC15|nr:MULTISPECIES: APC family permease [unclassified Acidisoma]
MVYAEGTPPVLPGLKTNSVRLPGAIIMSAAIMGPAVSTFFNPQFSTPFSGSATPFVYFLCLIAILIAASGIMEMAAVTPSAGSFYTYVTQGLGPRAGFITGGLMFMAYALLPPIEVALIGAYLQQTIQQQFGINIPWILIGLIPWAIMTFLALEGVQSSLRTAMVLFVVEVAVVLLMALIVVASGGAHGLSAHPLTPSASPHGMQGIITGFVFAALSFVGFEGATTLGEEVQRPRRNVPLAIALSTILVGVIYIFCIWAEVLGLGDAKINALTGASTPWNDLAHLYAPWMTPLIILASVSSMFAVTVNSNTGIVRILYTMGREGLLPRFLAHINPKRSTPSNAVLFQSAFTLIVVVIVGSVSGGLGNPDGGSNVYGFLGFLLTLAILIVYVLADIAAIVYFRRQGSTRLLRHILLPALGALLMTALFVAQIIEQTDAPYTWIPWVVVAWVVLLILGAAWLSVARPAILRAAGVVLG